MKVLHLLSQVELTGAEAYAIDLSEELIQHGHTCYIVSDKIHKKTKAQFIPLAIHNARFFRRIRSILFLIRFIRHNSVDIIHAHSRAAVRVGFWASKLTSKPLISTLHGKQHFSTSKRFFHIYGENILAVSDNIKAHFCRYFKYSPDRVQITRNFVNYDRIHNLTTESNPSPYKTISFLGRTTGPKGFNWEYIINNFAQEWLEQFPDIQLQWAGGDSSHFTDKTKNTLSKLRARFPERIKIIGLTEHLFQIISDSDLIVASGRIAIESLYLKKPLVALGEETFHGLVKKENWSQILASNFGDITERNKYQIPWDKVKSEIDSLLATKSPLMSDDTLNFLKQLTTQTFDRIFETNRIIKFYKSAQLKKHIRKNIPILMYHQVVDPPYESPHKIYVTRQTFRNHLDFLSKKGFQTLTFGELNKYFQDPALSTSFPKKPIIITFDDGYLNNLENALPILKEYNFTAIFYLLANSPRTNSWDVHSGAPELPLLNTSERLLLADTMEIGSHGLSHEKLSSMSDAQAEKEFYDSKKILEAEFGRPVISYAYTYGDRSDRDIRLAERAGYSFGLNTTKGVHHFCDNTYNLFRISIFPTDTTSDLARKTKSWYRSYYYWKRKE